MTERKGGLEDGGGGSAVQVVRNVQSSNPRTYETQNKVKKQCKRGTGIQKTPETRTCPQTPAFLKSKYKDIHQTYLPNLISL